MKSIIIDDEANSRELLHNMLSAYCPQMEVLAEAGSARQARDMITTLQPDVIFLDIEMPDGNGFELLGSLPPDLDFKTIFVTAFNEYAIQAIKTGATDYLLKPINPRELKSVIEKIEGLQSIKRDKANDTLLDEKELAQQLILPHQRGFKVVPARNIIRLEADDNYTQIILADSNKIITPRTLKEFENKLTSKWFLRIHRSHIINLYHFKEYLSEDGGYAVMSDNKRLSISKNKSEEFFHYIDILAGK